MANPEQRLRTDYNAQMAATTILGPAGPVAVGRLVGCVYCLRDINGRPLYVGQSTGTSERLGARLSRHVLGRRSDAAGRVFPTYEVFSIDVYPLRVPSTAAGALTPAEKTTVDRAEAHLYHLLAATKYPPLNERPPKVLLGGPPVVLPAAVKVPFTLDATLKAELWDKDARVERWTEVIQVMANRINTSAGTADQRRVLRLQVQRLRLLL